MSTSTDSTRIFTRKQVDDLLKATIGKTLLEIDKAQLFAHHEGRDKVKGIAGDITEESVLGCVHRGTVPMCTQLRQQTAKLLNAKIHGKD